MRFRLGMAIGCAGLAWGVGCAPPDRWEVFDTETLYAAPSPDPELADAAAEAPHPGGRTPPTLDAEGRLVLSIEEAALLALENNRDLRVRRLTPIITATFEDIERGVYDPELFARAEILEEEAVEISRATGENFPTEREDTAYEVGVVQRLPTGTTVELGVSSGRSTSNRAPEQQDARAGLTVTQSLLRGRGARVNLASVRQAELDTVASRYELQAFIETLLAETERTYWLHALAVQEIRIFEDSLEIAWIQEQQVEERIEIGVLAATERASAAAEVAQREQALIDARAELEVLRLRLLRLINAGGGPDDAPLAAAIVTTSEPRTDASILDDLADRVELAVRARPELNEARVLLEQARLETIVTRNGVLPRLDFFIALGKTGYADSFGRSFTNLDDDTYDIAAGIDLSAPLGNRAARARDRAAITGRRQAAESLANLEQLVRLEVRLAAAEVERARQQIAASAVTRSLREEALRAENERFEVGISTSLLVAQAQRDLLASRIAEVEALVAYRLALVDLYLAEGTLTQRRGIDLSAVPPRTR